MQWDICFLESKKYQGAKTPKMHNKISKEALY